MGITQEQFGEMFRTFTESAFRLEVQPAYKLTYEQVPLARFKEGVLLPPSQFGWWQEWLDLVAEHARHGRLVHRVRVLAEPPTAYQRWLLAADKWHAAAGDRIAWMPRSRAVAIGLPLDADWWLFDSAQAVVMRYHGDGEVRQMELVTDPAAIGRYCELRERALAHATTAEAIAAA